MDLSDIEVLMLSAEFQGSQFLGSEVERFKILPYLGKTVILANEPEPSKQSFFHPIQGG